MNPKLETIIFEAREMPSAERAAFLEKIYKEQPELREEAERFLARADAAQEYFETLENELDNSLRGEGPVIGSYHLTEKIGEGGFGVVWAAEQRRPFRRTVALKVIKAGMDTREVVARFEQERQALAMMDHPHIAQVFEAGETPGGRPYFVMEFVRGEAITKFCDDHGMGMRERLELFSLVCSAISHAHQKGIIHRDIKPANILVAQKDGKPCPKVIDFGIAKAIQSPLTEKTLVTRQEQFVGTPAYMSPEQATSMGQDIDTRSDIYSLGVLLYELLTGYPPFEQSKLLSKGYEEMRRVIREVESLRPSTRVQSSLQVPPSGERPKTGIGQTVEPDLDWIVMKALEKDRSRRYGSADAFAADIRRFLSDEPVSARPPGRGYLMRKFARRHRSGLSVAAVLLFLLVGGTVTSTPFAIRAREAERKLAIQVEDLRALGRQKDEAWEETREQGDLFSNLMQGADPAFGDRDITVARMLERVLLNSKTATPKPAILARIQSAVGRGYAALGALEKAMPLQEEALRFYDASTDYGPDSFTTIIAAAALASSYEFAGRTEQALTLQERVLKWYETRRVPGDPGTSEAKGRLGRLLVSCGQSGRGLALLEDAMNMSKKNPGPEALQTLTLTRLLAESWEESSDPVLREKARIQAGNLLLLCKKNLREFHPEAIRVLGLTSFFVTDAAKRAELQKGVCAQSSLGNGPLHPLTVIWAGRYGESLCAAGQIMEGWKLMEDALPHLSSRLSPLHPQTIRLMEASATVQKGSDPVQANERLQKVERLRLVAGNRGWLFSPDSRKVLSTAGILEHMAQNVERDSFFDEAIFIRESILPVLANLKERGPWHPETRAVRRALANTYLLANRRDDAFNLGNEALNEAKRLFPGDTHPFQMAVEHDLHMTQNAMGRHYEAFDRERRLLARLLRATPNDRDAIAASRAALATYQKATDFPQDRPIEDFPLSGSILLPTQEWKWLHPADGADPAILDPYFHQQFFLREFPENGWKTNTPFPANAALPGKGEFGYTSDMNYHFTAPAPGRRFSAYLRATFTTAT